MSLGGNCIQTWEDMKNVFLEKYHEYCQTGEYIFGIKQRENEILEDYVERFRYNLQISKHKNLVKQTLKTLLLKGIKDEFLEPLNRIGVGDVFHLVYGDVCKLWIRYLRGISKACKNSQEISS